MDHQTEFIAASRACVGKRLAIFLVAIIAVGAVLHLMSCGQIFLATWNIILFGGDNATDRFRIGFGIFMAVVSAKLFLLIFFAAYLIGREIRDLLMPLHLELHESKLRLVRPTPFGEFVSAEIPYRNIAKVNVASGRSRVLPLALTLHDANDAETKLPPSRQRERVLTGLPFRIAGGWTVPNADVADRIRKRCENLTASE